MKKFAVPDYVTAGEIKQLRNQLGYTQAELASLVNVSKKTIERWETQKTNITGPMVTLLTILNKDMEIPEELLVPEKIYPMRIWYMFQNKICTVMDIDEREQRIRIYNYTNNFIMRAFGKNEKPTYKDYEEFLESRCFPRTRDKIKLELKRLDLPFYDPLMIVEKTEGRMAEDDFWLRIER